MNTVVTKTKQVAVIVFALLVSGCATTKKLDDADRAKIDTVQINSQVEKGDIFLLAPGSSIGLMFGPVGAAIASGPMENARSAFATFLEQHSLSIEKIVYEEIQQALQASGKFAISNHQDPAVPSINISVPQYGFGVTHLLSSNVVPVLWIKCDLIDHSGKLLWSANDRLFSSIVSPIEVTTWEHLRNNPKEIEQRWREASKYLAQKIIDEL